MTLLAFAAGMRSAGSDPIAEPVGRCKRTLRWVRWGARGVAHRSTTNVSRPRKPLAEDRRIVTTARADAGVIVASTRSPRVRKRLRPKVG